MDTVLMGFLASLAAGLATGVGALPALFFRRVSDRLLGTMLGAAAGVMLAATSFSLVVPAIANAESLWPGTGPWIVAAGMLLGAGVLDLVDRKVPHEHFVLGREGPSSAMRRIWLFILAITIHNFPEGLAVGVGFGGGDVRAATGLAVGIGLQNMPEGLAVALPLLGLGYSRWRAVGIATMTGLVEPLGGLLGASVVSIFHPVLPFALAFAAGAMLFVISDEIIPETHSKGKARHATFGVMFGFVIMLLLDTVF